MSSPITIDQNLLLNVAVPVVMRIVDALRARKGSEPTVDEVKAELATDLNRARTEAAAFYKRHPELKPNA